MQLEKMPVPRLGMAQKGPLHAVEEIIIRQFSRIEQWFREQWLETPAPLTSSVDLRHAGFKLAPVDTNLFPAGFNNLNPDFMPLCIQAAQIALHEYLPTCQRVLLIPESHTRNPYYNQSLSVLQTIIYKAGFDVRIGNLDPEEKNPVFLPVPEGEPLVVEPLIRQDDRVMLEGFNPCFVLLNNDLSAGVPEVLQDLQQRIKPTAKLGWASRLKSSHFSYYDAVTREFAELTGMDQWLLNPLFSKLDGLDFMEKEGIEPLAEKVDVLLAAIEQKYQALQIKEKPFVVVKSDNGTYGMSILMVHDGDSLRRMNRKQRSKMSSGKGSQKVSRVLIQEGVPTLESMADGAVAEPVVYMIGQYVVGGFYRVHQGRGREDNLNAPGMHFSPLAFENACNMPDHALTSSEAPNRFYTYGVVARLAALAAAREIQAIGE
ncbi:MAG: glutamate--cysteine ligase [Legionellaceae bacterium]|nr:glutamate--cysteine ligase [Legionellaceae bacterium]